MVLPKTMGWITRRMGQEGDDCNYEKIINGVNSENVNHALPRDTIYTLLLTAMDLGLSEDPTSKSKKNTLSIGLTESAVFLSSDIHTRSSHINVEHRSTLLRGLLILNLVKPIKITSIEVELTATTSTAWQEGETDLLFM